MGYVFRVFYIIGWTHKLNLNISDTDYSNACWLLTTFNHFAFIQDQILIT